MDSYELDEEIEKLEKLVKLAKEYKNLMKDYEPPSYIPVYPTVPRPCPDCPYKQWKITWSDGTTGTYTNLHYTTSSNSD